MSQIDISTIRTSIKEALAAHEAFRRLGFNADSIFLCPEERVIVLVRRDGREFLYDVGERGCSQDEFVAEWQRCCALWNEDNSFAQSVYESSNTRLVIVQLIVAMAEVGILAPGQQDPMPQLTDLPN